MKGIEEIDKTLLNAPLKSVSEDAWVYLKEHWKMSLLSCAVVGSGLILGLLYGSPQLIVFAIAVAFFTGAYAVAQARVRFMQKVASALGMSFEPKGSLDSVDGDLFDFGHGQQIANVMSGQIHELPLRIYNYQTTVGSGKNSHMYRYTVFEITYGYELPHILLLERDGIIFRSEIRFSDGEEVRLEGDWSESYLLYVQKLFELEALQIFSPDVMVHFMDRVKKTNLETKHHKLYIFKDSYLSTKESLAEMYGVAELIAKILAPRFRQTSDSTSAMKEHISNNG